MSEIYVKNQLSSRPDLSEIQLLSIDDDFVDTETTRTPIITWSVSRSLPQSPLDA